MMFKRSRPFLKHFARDEQGGILIMFAFGLLVLMGVLMLSLDLGKTMLHQSNYEEWARNATSTPVKELAYMRIRCAAGATPRPHNLLPTCMGEGEALNIIDDYIFQFVDNNRGKDTPPFVHSRPQIRRNSVGDEFLYVSFAFPRSDVFSMEQGKVGMGEVIADRTTRTLSTSANGVLCSCTEKECRSDDGKCTIVESGKILQRLNIGVSSSGASSGASGGSSNGSSNGASSGGTGASSSGASSTSSSSSSTSSSGSSSGSGNCEDEPNTGMPNVRMMYVFDVSSAAAWGDKITGVNRDTAYQRLAGIGSTPGQVKRIFTELGYKLNCLRCGANLYGQLNVCTNSNCGCVPKIQKELGWDGCVYAPEGDVKDSASTECRAYQHRVYPINVYVGAYASPYCEAEKAVWVFEETPAGECKRNLNTYIPDKTKDGRCGWCDMSNEALCATHGSPHRQEQPPAPTCGPASPNPGNDFGGNLSGYCPVPSAPVPPCKVGTDPGCTPCDPNVIISNNATGSPANGMRVVINQCGQTLRVKYVNGKPVSPENPDNTPGACPATTSFTENIFAGPGGADVRAEAIRIATNNFGPSAASNMKDSELARLYQAYQNGVMLGLQNIAVSSMQSTISGDIESIRERNATAGGTEVINNYYYAPGTYNYEFQVGNGATANQYVSKQISGQTVLINTTTNTVAMVADGNNSIVCNAGVCRGGGITVNLVGSQPVVSVTAP